MARDQGRREFLARVAVGGPIVGVAVGAGASVASATESGGTRRVVAARPGAPFSRAVVLDNLVYVAGVVGRIPNSPKLASREFRPQCLQVMENLKASVEASGSSMAKVLKCNCFLTDVSDFPVMNELFRSYFPSDPPARSTVVVKELVVAGAKIEIDCIAGL